jgi:hypothetical protein
MSSESTNASTTEPEEEPSRSPTQLKLSASGARIVLLWIGMITLFVTLWHWVGPGSLD